VERTGKLYEFLDKLRDDVISANKSNSEDSENRRHEDMIASITAHS
jgi:hypothetical protein